MNKPEKRSIMSSTSVERRIQCPGSVAEQELPRAPAGPAAEEGLALHDLMYQTLDSGKKPPRTTDFEWLGADKKTRYSLESDVLWGKFWPVFNALTDLLEKYQISEYDLEVRHNHMEGGPDDVYGYCDLIGRGQDVGLIVDYKFGAQLVAAENNPQLAFLAKGAIDAQDALFQGLRKYVLCIIQPDFEGQAMCSEWQVDRNYLKAFAAIQAHAFKRIAKGDKTRKAGHWCKWCGLQPVCETANMSLTQLSVPINPERISLARLAVLLQTGALAVTQYESLLKYAHAQALRGVEIPGHKLVQSWGNRQWTDTDAVIAQASADEVEWEERKLKSPAQLEKAYKKAKLDISAIGAYTARPDRGLRLVPDTDRRDAVQVQNEDISNQLALVKGS